MAATDIFSRFQDRFNIGYSNAATVTPGTADLGFTTRGLYVTAGGSVSVVMAGTAGGTAAVSFGSVPTGTWLPVRATKVTVASGAVALW